MWKGSRIHSLRLRSHERKSPPPLRGVWQDSHHSPRRSKTQPKEKTQMNPTEYQKRTELTNIYRKAVSELVKHAEAVEPALRLSYLGMGLCSEAGEVAGLLKKSLRDGGWDREKLVKELGDVMWYISQICNETGIDLGIVMGLNIIKLNERKEKGTLKGSGDNR